MKKRIFSLWLAVFVCFGLIACGAAPEETAPATEIETAEQTEQTQPDGHVYDHDCDEECNECGQIRTVADHSYENACDGTCDICGYQREVSDHEYDGDCDGKCNTCGTKRIASHGELDQVGYCAACTDYIGTTGDANYEFTMEFDGVQTKYFRVQLGRNMKQAIRFSGQAQFDYVAYVATPEGYQKVELTQTPQPLPESEYLYLVITQKDGASSVEFQIEEMQ